LHANRRVNNAVGVAMALLFPAPFHLIRQGHLGHHRRNRSDDEAFDYYFANDRPWLKWLILYGILTGFYWMLVVLSNLLVALVPSLLHRRHFEFDRPSVAFMDSLNPRYIRYIRCEGIAACALHAAIIYCLGISPLNYFLVYFGFGFSWSAMQYVHHFGTERHVLRGSRNLWLFAPIDLLWLHHNWHLAHHQQPTVPWIYLPQLSRDRQETDRDFLLWHYLRMWRGPRKTDERVENKYAGKIIQ
jgi:fatty acid desaturase